jgi:hypothetical protein
MFRAIPALLITRLIAQWVSHIPIVSLELLAIKRSCSARLRRKRRPLMMMPNVGHMGFNMERLLMLNADRTLMLSVMSMLAPL